MKRRDFLQSTILALASTYFSALPTRQSRDLSTLPEEYPLVSGWAPRATASVQAATDLLTYPGLIGMDFADLRAVLGRRGQQRLGALAVVGFGEAAGENRAIRAAEDAIKDLKRQLVLLRNARVPVTPPCQDR